MIRTILASAVLLALTSCGPSRSELTAHDAEIKALIEGWSMACLMAPAFMRANSEAEADASLSPCLDGYVSLWENPNTRIEAEVFAYAANICRVDREFQAAAQAEDMRAVEMFNQCFDESRNLRIAAIAEAGRTSRDIHREVDDIPPVRVPMIYPNVPPPMVNCTTTTMGRYVNTTCR